MVKTIQTASTSQIVSSVCVTINENLKDKGLGIPQKIVKDIIGTFLDVVASETASGHKVRVDGIGILQAKDRATRMGRNPQTGEEIRIPASRRVAFRAAHGLKERVTGVKKSSRATKSPSKKKK